MPRRKLKNVADSTIAFRISTSEKKKLESQIDKTRVKLNTLIPENEYKATKNEIIISALKLGLEKLKVDSLPKRNKKKLTQGG